MTIFRKFYWRPKIRLLIAQFQESRKFIIICPRFLGDLPALLESWVTPRNLRNSSILPSRQYGANMPWTNPNPSPICPTCSRSVFPAEAYMASDRRPHHKQCVKCVHCSKRLSASTLNEHAGKLYCNLCYTNMFMPQVQNNNVSGYKWTKVLEKFRALFFSTFFLAQPFWSF